jgi:hypothetical protein
MLHNDIQTEIDNALMDLVQQDKMDISVLEKLLSGGANPNILIRKEIFLGRVIQDVVCGTYQNEYTVEVEVDKYTYETYTPLHLVKDMDAVKLLLMYGANAYQSVDKNASPLEYAAVWEHYSKVALMAASSAVLKPEIINKTINIILNNFQKNKLPKDAKDTINILISKSQDITAYPDSFLFIVLNGEDDVIGTMIGFHFDKIICHLRKKSYFNLSDNCMFEIRCIQAKCFDLLDEIRSLYLILGFYYGYLDNNSIISSLPAEILLHIGSYVCSLSELSAGQVHWGMNTLSVEEDMQVSAFKKFYTLMNMGDRSIFASHEFLDKTLSLSNYQLMYKIREKINKDYDGMTTLAWQLACQHYQNCHSDNHVLMMIMTNWCINKDPLVKIIPDSLSFFNNFSLERKKEIYHSMKNNFDELNKLDGKHDYRLARKK